MNKTTQLWIRACKSKNPDKRLRSILRRFYLVNFNEAQKTEAIIYHLSDIVDKYLTLRVYDIYCELIKEEWYGTKDDRTPEQKMLSFLAQKIAYTSIHKLEGLTPPCWVKNKEMRGLVTVS